MDSLTVPVFGVGFLVLLGRFFDHPLARSMSEMLRWGGARRFV